MNMNFWKWYGNSVRATFKTIFDNPSALGTCHLTIIAESGWQENGVFLSYLGDLYLHKIFSVKGTYRFIAADNKEFILSALVIQERGPNVPLWTVFDIFEPFILGQAFDLGRWSFTKN